MWIFGYGSLMEGSWARALGCDFSGKATLADYQRAFNKASVRNWGSPDCKCLTLNIERHDGASCTGVAFRFPEDRRQNVLDVLVEREGKQFTLQALTVSVLEIGDVEALVPIYSGRNLVPAETVPEVLQTMRSATGRDGSCIEYVDRVQQVLESIGIEDPVVRDTWLHMRPEAQSVGGGD